MTEVFFESDYLSAKKQVKNLIIVYSVILAIFILISAGLLIWFKTLPYKSPTITIIKAIHYTITAIFVICTFIFFGIKFKRANRYKKMCNNLLTGLREDNEAEFLRYDQRIYDKDGVDCRALIFSEWNRFKHDYFDRKVLVLAEKPFPQFIENKKYRFITQGNVLVSYCELEEEK